MVTQKKRIALTVPAELDATISALADLQGVPKTAVIMDFLESVHPAMKQLQSALEEVKDKKNPQAALSALFISLTEQYSEVATDYASLASKGQKHD